MERGAAVYTDALHSYMTLAAVYGHLVIDHAEVTSRRSDADL
ncbi:MAG: hypothetical protein R2745_11140 [Vicinamibacterales bacterium]